MFEIILASTQNPSNSDVCIPSSRWFRWFSLLYWPKTGGNSSPANSASLLEGCKTSFHIHQIGICLNVLIAVTKLWSQLGFVKFDFASHVKFKSFMWEQKNGKSDWWECFREFNCTCLAAVRIPWALRQTKESSCPGRLGQAWTETHEEMQIKRSCMLDTWIYMIHLFFTTPKQVVTE